MHLKSTWLLSVGLLLVVGTLGCREKQGTSTEEQAIAELKKHVVRFKVDEEKRALQVYLAATQLTDDELEPLKGLTSLR
jgi:hypothetical protein